MSHRFYALGFFFGFITAFCLPSGAPAWLPLGVATIGSAFCYMFTAISDENSVT